MSYVGCFYLCEVLINLKTDVPDGIELGKEMMKKKNWIGLSSMLAILLLAIVACTKEPTPDPVYPGGGGSEGGGNSGGNGYVSNVPTGLSAIVIGSQIKVSWNEVPQTFDYKVYRASNSSGPYTWIYSTTGTYVYDESPNTNNYYKVTARDWNLNESEMSNYVYCRY